ncbi:MAG: aspartate aminotransferase family protein [Atribacterota bacterium]|nr:aspartate aminotransferase family protein [Atribacterota bacterium]MDD4895152.1 aspartate aminotransferase family protein [Atribacterota bacterium]MDD5637199.1 aspartate aminotransferase family protein [Atribacterota bacterium]
MKKFISIKTDIPGPKSRELAAIRERYVFKPMGDSLSPGYIDFGEGALVTDVDGNTFIDLTGGWGCLALGHSHPAIISAIKEQVNHFIHTDFTAVPYESFVLLCQRLSQLAPGSEPKSVALFNSGAEAIENAVKVARGFTGRSGIIVFENCFHGRTLLTLTMTHKAFPYKYKFGPFAPEVYRLPYPNSYRHSIEISEFENIMKGLVNPETIAAIVIEPIQGEGGFNIPIEGFLEHIRKLCNKYEILMVTDEIQCGMGRTGKFFAIENWKIAPDIACLAKSLASGLPLSAVIARKEIGDALPAGCIGGTYAGNPIACQVALEVIRIMEQENLLNRAVKIGEIIKQRFKNMEKKYNIIGDVRGLGAMVAMELVKDRMTKEPATEETEKIVQYCIQNGVLIPTAGINKNVLRILVSFVITEEQLEEAMDVLEEAFSVIN